VNLSFNIPCLEAKQTLKISVYLQPHRLMVWAPKGGLSKNGLSAISTKLDELYSSDGLPATSVEIPPRKLARRKEAAGTQC
jgi:hypothetical protein